METCVGVKGKGVGEKSWREDAINCHRGGGHVCLRVCVFVCACACCLLPHSAIKSRSVKEEWKLLNKEFCSSATPARGITLIKTKCGNYPFALFVFNRSCREIEPGKIDTEVPPAVFGSRAQGERELGKEGCKTWTEI